MFHWLVHTSEWRNNMVIAFQTGTGDDSASEQVGHGTVTCISDQCRVLGQHTSSHDHLGLLPSAQPRFDLFIANIHAQGVVLRVDGDFVTVLDDSNGTSNRSLRNDMTDDKPVTRSAVSAVSDQGHVREIRAGERSRSLQLLGHTRTALGALVPDHQHELLVARDGNLPQRGVELRLLVEDARFAGEAHALLARDLGDRAARRQIAAQDLQVARFLDGVRERPDDDLLLRQAREAVDVLLQRLARDGRDIAVQQARGREQLHDAGHAADLVEVRHEILAGGRQVRDERHLVADVLEVLERERHVGRPGHGQQVQHAVGRATQRHHHRHCVLKALLGQEVARPDVALHAYLDALGRLLALPHLGWFRRRRARRSRKRKSHGFDGGAHGVGCIHAATGASTRARMLLNIIKNLILGLRRVIWVRERVVDVSAVSFIASRDVNTLVEQITKARLDGSTVDHDGRSIMSRKRHDTAGHVLVASRDSDTSIVMLSTGDGLYTVGDDLSCLQGEAHACESIQFKQICSIMLHLKLTFASHGDSIRDTNGIVLPSQHTQCLH